MNMGIKNQQQSSLKTSPDKEIGEQFVGRLLEWNKKRTLAKCPGREKKTLIKSGLAK